MIRWVKDLGRECICWEHSPQIFFVAHAADSCSLTLSMSEWKAWHFGWYSVVVLCWECVRRRKGEEEWRVSHMKACWSIMLCFCIHDVYVSSWLIMAVAVSSVVRCSNGKGFIESSTVGEEWERYTGVDESSGDFETLDRHGRIYVLSKKSRHHDRDAEGNEWWWGEENSVW